MSLPEVDLTTWFIPHRNWGHLVHISIDLILTGSECACGFVQSLQHAAKLGRVAELDFNKPHRRFDVPFDQMGALVQQARSVSIGVGRPPQLNRFGASFFGLRVADGFREVALVWNGDFDSEAESVIQLYRAIESLAGIKDHQWNDDSE